MAIGTAAKSGAGSEINSPYFPNPYKFPQAEELFFFLPGGSLFNRYVIFPSSYSTNASAVSFFSAFTGATNRLAFASPAAGRAA